MVVPSFVGQAVVGDDITVYGDGTQRRSFCDVRDTVEVLTRLAANPAAHGQIVNVGNAQEVDIKSLAELVRERAQSRSKITYTSYEEAYGEAFEDVFRRRPDLTLQTQLTDYKPHWTLVETIDDLVETERKRAAALYRAAKR
jgi:UDP-glucose 4-epimerase